MKMMVNLCAMFLLAASPALAMGERQPAPDPACFSSDTLRVKIGGEKFAFPKEIIHSVQGDDVVNTTQPKSKSASKYNACQKPDDPFWRLNTALLKLSPLECSDKRDCNRKEINVTYYGTSGYDENYFLRNVERDLKSCRSHLDTGNKYMPPCHHNFMHKSSGISILFSGDIYPPEQIEQTKQFVIDEIYQHKID